MGAWDSNCETHVATMTHGDFKANEKSLTIDQATAIKIQLVKNDGTTEVLKAEVPLLEGEIIDATYMSKEALVSFLSAQVADAKAKGVLFSLHMKATMMKVSDPIIFGYAVSAFFADVFAKYGSVLTEAGINPNNGLEALLNKLETLDETNG